MEITWLGESALLLRGRMTKVLVDPDYQEAGGRGNPPGEIVVSGKAGENRLRPGNGVRVVARAGEYELSGVSVRGVRAGLDIAFVAEVDEVSVCDLGGFAGALDEDALDLLGSLDVLAVSLQGGTPERAREVAALVSQLQPAVLIPVGYRLGADGAMGELAPLAHELGIIQITPQAKLNLSGAAGASDDTRVVILEARR